MSWAGLERMGGWSGWRTGPDVPYRGLMDKTVFVAGATGYSGRNVVASALRRGIRTVAHVRPDSPGLDRWRRAFEEQGAVVDTSAWTPEGMTGALAAHRPDFVFALLGTTKKRARSGGGSYEAVDYGLTAMLLRASAETDSAPCFVYLSAAGAGGRAMNAYMKVRARMESEIDALDLPHLIARPAFITGDDRDERRPAERIGAIVLDGVLDALAAVGVRGPRERWASMTGTELGAALVALAVDGHRGVVDVPELRSAV